MTAAVPANGDRVRGVPNSQPTPVIYFRSREEPFATAGIMCFRLKFREPEIGISPRPTGTFVSRRRALMFFLMFSNSARG